METKGKYLVGLLEPTERNLEIAGKFDVLTAKEGMDQAIGDAELMSRRSLQEFLRDTPHHTSVWAAFQETPSLIISFLYVYSGDRATKNRIEQTIDSLTPWTIESVKAFECNNAVAAWLGPELVSLKDEDYIALAGSILKTESDFLLDLKQEEFPGQAIALLRYLAGPDENGKSDQVTDFPVYLRAGFRRLKTRENPEGKINYSRPSSTSNLETNGDVVVVKTQNPIIHSSPRRTQMYKGQH